MSKKKHLHRYEWLSFSENEKALLEAYIAKMQQAGYEVQKIARFYIRFKYKGSQAQCKPVYAYRRNYFSHLRWEMDQTHQYISKPRSRFNGLMIGLCLLVFAIGLYWVTHLPAWVILRNVTLVGVLLLPVFALSFALDFAGRLHDSLSHEYQFDLRLVTPRLRAALLSMNMGMRYVLFFVFLLPTIVTELKLQVVFVICMLGISSLFRYYMPIRYRRYYYGMAVLLSIFICFVVNAINEREQFYKPNVDFEALPTLHTHDLVDQVDENAGYKTMIHQEASNSFLVPLTYRYEETRINLNNTKDRVSCKTVLYKVEDEIVRNYLIHSYSKEQVTPITWLVASQEVQLYVLNSTSMLIVNPDCLLYLQASTGLYPEQQPLIEEIILAYL